MSRRRHHFSFRTRSGRDPIVAAAAAGGASVTTWAVAGLGALGLAAAAFFLNKPKTATTDPNAPAPAPQPAAPVGPPAQPSPAPVVPATPVPSQPVAPPVPTNASLAKVLTHDPPPSGDLNVFDRPNGSRIGGAEKDSIVNVISNDGTWAQVTANNPEGRYPAVTGFVHAAFLGDPSATVAQNLGQAAINTAQGIASALGF
jgi:hypothetical protein